MKIRFKRDTTLWVINNLWSPPYEEIYKKGDVEHVDIIDETETHAQVQFENGETSTIPKDSIEFMSCSNNQP